MNSTTFKNEIHEINTELNSIAEVSWKEQKTTEYLTTYLKDYTIERFNKTGFLLQIDGEIKDAIAFRTDIDALPYRLNNELKVLHACGHDVHMTILTGFILKLKEMDYKPKHTLKFIFQPAEELGEGAKYVVEHEQEVFEHVHYLFGMHVRPLNELKKGQFSASIQHGASGTIYMDVITKVGHAGRPWESINSIDIVMEIYEHIKRINMGSNRNYSIKMTKINTMNGQDNSIPGHVSVTFDIRANYNDMMDELIAVFNKMIDDRKVQYAEQDVLIDTRIDSYTVAAQIDTDAKEYLKKAIKSKGFEYVDTIYTPGAEDFHNYTYALPNIKSTMLGIGCNMEHGLHHPDMKLDKSVIFDAIEIFYQLLIDIDK